MKTAERIFGFASCALGLLPLIEPVNAQQQAPIACQSQASGNAGSNVTVPLVVNSGQQRLVICGYGITALGATTGAGSIWTGFGSTCTTSGSIMATQFSAVVYSGEALSRQNLATILAPQTSVCLVTVANTTAASAEISYSIQ